MKMYKGLATIECKIKKCILKKPLKEVEPECSNCKNSIIKIIDLEGKLLTTIIKNKVQKTKIKEK